MESDTNTRPVKRSSRSLHLFSPCDNNVSFFGEWLSPCFQTKVMHSFLSSIFCIRIKIASLQELSSLPFVFISSFEVFLCLLFVIVSRNLLDLADLVQNLICVWPKIMAHRDLLEFQEEYMFVSIVFTIHLFFAKDPQELDFFETIG